MHSIANFPLHALKPPPGIYLQEMLSLPSGDGVNLRATDGFIDAVMSVRQSRGYYLTLPSWSHRGLSLLEAQ